MVARVPSKGDWKKHWWRGVAATSLLMGVLVGPAAPTTLAGQPQPPPPCIVTSAADSGSAGTTLREKLADTNCAEIQIPAATGSPITLTQGVLLITHDVNIVGPGAALLTISGNNASRVFKQPSGTAVTIRDLTISNGNAGTNIPQNDSGDGGGIASEGPLDLVNVTITNNVAAGSGGGVYSLGGVILTGATVSNNQANGGSGGGINAGMAVITDSTVSDNTSASDGGGIAAGDLTLANTTLNNNHGARGGAIYTTGTTTLNNATITSNVADQSGGALYSANSVAFTNSRVTGNRAVNSGGGIALSNKANSFVRTSLIQGNTAFIGGGVATLDRGFLLIEQSAIVGNTARVGGPNVGAASLGGIGGGIFNADQADMNIVHSTISGNTASTAGGGLYNQAVQATVAVQIATSTIANNTAGSDGGGTYSDTDSQYTPTTIIGSIVTGNTAGGAANNARGVLKSYGYNVVQTGTTGFTETGDMVVADAGLAPLAMNAPGTTPTHALLAGSPAIDLIPGATCVASLQSGTPPRGPYAIADQRGVTRPQGPNCDAGAYEVAAAPAPTIAALNPTSVPAGSAATITITGTGFLPNGFTVVTVGGVAYPITYVSPTEITVALPASALTAAGSLPVVVTNSAPGGGSANAALTVTPATNGFTLTRTVDGNGTATVTPAPDVAGIRYSAGTVVTSTPQNTATSHLVGWRVDGIFQGWSATLDLTMNGDHTVQAIFRAPATFADAPNGSFASTAIGELATRGIIKGYADGTFGPTDLVLRAQLAALIGRAMGSDPASGPGVGPATWATEDHGNTFADRNGVDDELWRVVGSLAYHNVARGYGDGSYDPTGTVSHAQAISLITRAMVAKGYWTQQPDDASIYGAIPAGSGHRADVATFAHYVGALPRTAPTDRYDGPTGWNGPASRAWVAEALWAALSNYHPIDRVP